MTNVSTELKELLDNANYKASFNSQMNLIRTTFKEACLYYAFGGTFTLNPAFLLYIKGLVERGEKRSVLIDDFENPIMVDDIDVFYDTADSLYKEAVNEFYNRFIKLSRARRVERIIEVA